MPQNEEDSGFDVNNFLNPEFRAGNVQRQHRRIAQVSGPYPEPPPLPNRVITPYPPEPPPLPQRVPLPYPPEPPPLPNPIQPVQPYIKIPQALVRPPILPSHITPIRHPTIPWLKVPREFTPAGATVFANTPKSHEPKQPNIRKLCIEDKYFTTTIPYCNMASNAYSQHHGILARRVAIPWRIPETVPCAELRRAVEIINPLVRAGTLDLADRESFKITHELFKSRLSTADKALVNKWCAINLKSLTTAFDNNQRDNDMKELQILYGRAKDSETYICSELRALYRHTYFSRRIPLIQVAFIPWTIHEVSEIWKVYNADRTNEGMYDRMHFLLNGRRNHRSIMRMLEFILYCEENPEIANPNMLDAFTTADIPDDGAPDNPLDTAEMKTLLELREYFGPQNDWNGLVGHMYRYAEKFGYRRRGLRELQDLYCRHGLDYLVADVWTADQDKKLQIQRRKHGVDWEKISRPLKRTPHAAMARSLFLDNGRVSTAIAGPSIAGAGPPYR